MSYTDNSSPSSSSSSISFEIDVESNNLEKILILDNNNNNNSNNISNDRRNKSINRILFLIISSIIILSTFQYIFNDKQFLNNLQNKANGQDELTSYFSNDNDPQKPSNNNVHYEDEDDYLINRKHDATDKKTREFGEDSWYIEKEEPNINSIYNDSKDF